MLRYLTVLILAISIISCSEKSQKENSNNDLVITNPEYGIWQDRENPLEFELIDSVSIQLPDDFILSSISNLTTDQDGNYYFMDNAQAQLISIAADGSLRWITGKKGRGPGDFENVWDIIIIKNSILVSNINSSRLDYFDLDGNFMKSIPMNKKINFASIEGINDAGNLIISGPRWGSFGHKIFIVKLESDSLSILNSFEIDETNGVNVPESFTAKSEITIIDDKIITGDIHAYSFSIYDMTGTLTKTVNRDFDKIVPPGMYVAGNSSTMNSFGMTEPPFKISDELYLATATWPTNVSDPDQFTKRAASGSSEKAEFMNSIDFFNSNWKLLYSLESNGFYPDIGRIRFAKDGHIFTANTDPSPTIYRYKIITEG